MSATINGPCKSSNQLFAWGSSCRRTWKLVDCHVDITSSKATSTCTPTVTLITARHIASSIISTAMGLLTFPMATRSYYHVDVNICAIGQVCMLTAKRCWYDTRMFAHLDGGASRRIGDTCSASRKGMSSWLSGAELNKSSFTSIAFILTNSLIIYWALVYSTHVVCLPSQALVDVNRLLKFNFWLYAL